MDLYHGDTNPPFDGDPDGGFDGDGVLVRTASRVPLELKPIRNDLAPEGCACLGSFLRGNLIARCVVREETAAQFLRMDLLEKPVHLALLAQEEEPGLQGKLLALTPVDEAEGLGGPAIGGGEDEPWKDSVPGSGYDEVVEGGRGDSDDEKVAAIFLGKIIRFQEDRKHPDDLAMEAADVLRTAVKGSVSDVVDRLLRDVAGMDVDLPEL